MSLIICTECGKEFSNKASCCPNCGCPTEEIINSNSKEPEKEELNLDFEMKISGGMFVKIFGRTVEIYKGKEVLLRGDVEDFILTWAKEKKIINSNSLDILFIHPRSDKDFQISGSKDSFFNGYKESYDKGIFFLENIAEPYFKKDIQKSFMASVGYGRKVNLNFKKNSKLVCPRCGGENLRVEFVQIMSNTKSRSEVRKKSPLTRAGNKAGRGAMIAMTGGLWALTPKKSDYIEKGNSVSTIGNKKIGICLDCGKSWDI